MKKLVTTGLVAAGLFALTPMAPASADTPGCVTRAEFQRVDRGMLNRRVHRIFDTDGRLSSSSRGGGGDSWREYRVCRSWGSPRWSDVSINFDNYSFRNRGPGMRLYSKDAYISR